MDIHINALRSIKRFVPDVSCRMVKLPGGKGHLSCGDYAILWARNKVAVSGQAGFTTIKPVFGILFFGSSVVARLPIEYESAVATRCRRNHRWC
jgi:hypothetical protein